MEEQKKYGQICNKDLAPNDYIHSLEDLPIINQTLEYDLEAKKLPCSL
jgi:hypothetical protein